MAEQLTLEARELTEVPHALPQWIVLLICSAGQFMVVLDVTIVNVALPHVQLALGLDATGL